MVHDLYAVPLDQFVTRRDELARELTAAGDPEEAKRVKGLRKPTVTAAELNRLARDQPRLVAALVAAHEEMRSAGSGDALRAGSDKRAAAIRAILEAVEDATDAVRQKMRSTLLAAGTDPAAEEALVEGRLERELEPSGLSGFGMGVEFTAPSAPTEAPPLPSRRARERADRLAAEAAAADDEARKLRQAADRAERLAAAAEERAAKKRQAADDAKQALDT